MHVSKGCSYFIESKTARKSFQIDTEAEYRAMSAACSKILLLRGLLAELDFKQKSLTPLHADNTSAIRITENPVFHEGMKRIEVDFYFIRDEYLWNVISLPFISSGLQVLIFLPKLFLVRAISSWQTN